MSILETLTAVHRACDAEFVKIEHAVHRADWDEALETAQRFVAATEAHFRYEEDILFPVLELAAPMAVAPNRMMRTEHAQMRSLFAELEGALKDRDVDAVIDTVDILLLLLQQHNAKEESVLYALADRVLDDELGRAQALQGGAA